MRCGMGNDGVYINRIGIGVRFTDLPSTLSYRMVTL